MNTLDHAEVEYLAHQVEQEIDRKNYGPEDRPFLVNLLGKLSRTAYGA